ncbi:MAG: hypothetical protein LBF15_00170 [Candidatus Peribacteria bacterium]|jgi:hypothetical protein|nr:hypothetical protein [Candidatus Peribacteria bacterium]
MSTTDVCNLELKNSYDETGLLEYLIYFVFTARLTIAIFWFFVLKYLRRKIREKFGV